MKYGVAPATERRGQAKAANSAEMSATATCGQIAGEY